jgi:hypothetical protein
VLILAWSGAYFANSPREMGIRTADGTLLLIMTVLKGVTRRVSSRLRFLRVTLLIIHSPARTSTVGMALIAIPR